MKYVVVFVVLLVVIFTYIIMAASQPAVNDIMTTVNASANWTNAPDAQAVVNSWPIYMWAIPGAVGVIIIVWALKSGGAGFFSG